MLAAKVLSIIPQDKWGGGAPAGRDGGVLLRYRAGMAENFTRHRQPWKADEVAKLHTLAGKGKGLKEIAKALNRHGGLVEFRDLVSVNIDHRQMGLGGINSWGALPLEKYRLPAKEYGWRFRMVPLAPGDDPAAARSPFASAK